MKKNYDMINTKRIVIYLVIVLIVIPIIVDKCLQTYGKEKHWTLELSDGSIIKGNFRKSLFSFSAAPNMTIFKWEVKKAQED
ncbi:hypothetical protein C1631_022735 [Chryseobacterium phosphatilyticum]|uniref:Uncharacterized protein n=1 Tax=Chryseobacterium phosphatilyticum TaxID=475075 RepID=A0A316WLT9_9FLAO|nr:hypothetical protein [Chryseobacterium phosphatilyticum]PWN62384.1 hypothetical protein C1631_022735 [Chryseobacterium phosphatilyticum]